MTRATTFAACVLVLVAACGDSGGTLTVEEYFTAVELASLTYDREADAAEAAGEAFEDPVEGFKETFGAGSVLLGDFVDTLDSLNPPDSLSDLHAQTVRNGTLVSEAVDALVAEVNNAETVDDLNGLVGSDTFEKVSAASDEFTASCFELTQAASENGITVDLRCG